MKDREVQIMKYVSGQLVGDELDMFEKEMSVDTDLKEEVAIYQQLNGFSAKRKDINASLSTLGKVHEDFSKNEKKILEEPKDVKSNFWKWLLPILIVIGIIASTMLLNNTNTSEADPEVLFARYFNPDEASFQTKGDSSSEDLIRAQIYFNRGDYQNANEIFETLISEKEGEVDLVFYNSLALIGINQHLEGRSQLETLAEDAPMYQKEAYWYIALSFMKEGNKNKAKEYLTMIKEGSNKYPKAQELLQLL